MSITVLVQTLQSIDIADPKTWLAVAAVLYPTLRLKVLPALKKHWPLLQPKLLQLAGSCLEKLQSFQLIPDWDTTWQAWRVRVEPRVSFVEGIWHAFVSAAFFIFFSMCFVSGFGVIEWKWVGLAFAFMLVTLSTTAHCLAFASRAYERMRR